MLEVKVQQKVGRRVMARMFVVLLMVIIGTSLSMDFYLQLSLLYIGPTLHYNTQWPKTVCLVGDHTWLCLMGFSC